MCDCWIGILNDYDQSDVNNLILSSLKETLEYKAELSGILHSSGISKNRFSVLDYIDRRRGLATLFNFCPLCGNKIDWVKLRKELKE